MKALKELAQQRKKLEKVLNEIKKTTRQSISRLEMRVKNMEAAARIKSEYGEFPEFVSQGGGSPSHKSENKLIYRNLCFLTQFSDEFLMALMICCRDFDNSSHHQYSVDLIDETLTRI